MKDEIDFKEKWLDEQRQVVVGSDGDGNIYDVERYQKMHESTGLSEQAIRQKTMVGQILNG